MKYPYLIMKYCPICKKDVKHIYFSDNKNGLTKDERKKQEEICRICKEKEEIQKFLATPSLWQK